MRTTVGGDVDVLGGGWGYGGGNYGGMWIFAFLIIFFIVLIFFRRHDGQDGHNLGSLAAVLPLLELGKHKDDDLRVEQAHDTDKIRHTIDTQAEKTRHDINEQNRLVEKTLDRNLLEMKNDELAKARLEIAELHADKRFLDLKGDICKLESKVLKKPEYYAQGAYINGYDGCSPAACASR